MSETKVLIGAPGAGKSTVGQLLAQALECSFVDSDSVIEKNLGMPISEIFIQESEQYFRKIEKQVVLDLLTNFTGVLSLGGGSVLDEEVQRELANHLVIWLQVSLADAVERVGLNQSRPLLLGNVRSNMKNLLTERNHIYQNLATHIVDATNSPQAIVRSIIEKIQVI
ncbi:MAG: shikimate kinase [Candidatus Nanopelagicales bacterium]